MKFLVNIQSIVDADSLALMLSDGIDLPEEAVAITFQLVQGDEAAPVPASAATPIAPARKRAAARKAKTKATKNAATTEDEELDTGADDAGGSKFKDVTSADVKGVLRDILKVKSLGGDAAKALLGQFKAANVSQVAEGDYADLIAAGRQIIEEAELTS